MGAMSLLKVGAGAPAAFAMATTLNMTDGTANNFILEFPF
jgi:hypothetical protein